MPIQKLSTQNNGWIKKEAKIFRRNSVISQILHWLDQVWYWCIKSSIKSQELNPSVIIGLWPKKSKFPNIKLLSIVQLHSSSTLWMVFKKFVTQQGLLDPCNLAYLHMYQLLYQVLSYFSWMLFTKNMFTYLKVEIWIQLLQPNTLLNSFCINASLIMQINANCKTTLPWGNTKIMWLNK